MKLGKNYAITLTLRTKNKNLYHNGKTVTLEPVNYWVCFVTLMKAVVKTCSSKYITSTWGDFDLELDEKDKHMILSEEDTVFIHIDLLCKFVESRVDSCKKTWGVFYADGLFQLVKDIKELKKKSVAEEKAKAKQQVSESKTEDDASSAPLPVVPVSRKRKQTHSNDDTMCMFSDSLQDREKLVMEREAAIAQREQVLNARESLLAKRESKVQTLQKEVQQMKKTLESQPEFRDSQNLIVSKVNQFLIECRGIQKRLTDEINEVVNKQNKTIQKNVQPAQRDDSTHAEPVASSKAVTAATVAATEATRGTKTPQSTAVRALQNLKSPESNTAQPDSQTLSESPNVLKQPNFTERSLTPTSSDIRGDQVQHPTVIDVDE